MSDYANAVAEIGARIDAARATVVGDKAGLKGTSLLSIADLSPAQLATVLNVTEAMDMAHKLDRWVVRWDYPKGVILFFEKPSLRTRVSFEMGVSQLGGHSVVLGPAEIGLGKRETPADAARVFERMAKCIMGRVFDHHLLEELRDAATIPVINGLSDLEHPCQALADLYTIIQKKGKLEGVKLAWLGDGNNVYHSLALAGAMAGMTVAAACPNGYLPDEKILAKARELAGDPGRIVVTQDPAEAVAGADVIYTDVWTSMGQEAEKEERLKVFRPYQANAALMAHAKPDAIFMHCLPAHRGEEVTADVLEGPQSVVFQEAENRLHAQKAVMALLIGA